MNEKQVNFLISLIAMCIANTRHGADWREIKDELLEEFEKLGDD